MGNVYLLPYAYPSIFLSNPSGDSGYVLSQHKNICLPGQGLVGGETLLRWSEPLAREAKSRKLSTQIT